MPETEARAPAIYDRERELTDPELGSSGRHRRPAPDWGGDELFARGSRRRNRAQARHEPRPDALAQAEPPHGLVRAERGTGAGATDEWAPPPRDHSAADEWSGPARDRSATDEWTVRVREATRASSAARLDRPSLDPGPAARPRPDRGEPDSRGAAGRPVSTADSGEPAPDHGSAVRPHVTADHTEPPVGGRRTVLITGRPGTQRTGTPWARPHTERRRPPRTIDERLGARPDRVAAWAFGLGLLLILIAVTTADAATLP